MFLNRLAGHSDAGCRQLACLPVYERQRDNSLVSDALSCGHIAPEPPLVRPQVLCSPSVLLWALRSTRSYASIVVQRSAALVNRELTVADLRLDVKHLETICKLKPQVKRILMVQWVNIYHRDHAVCQWKNSEDRPLFGGLSLDRPVSDKQEYDFCSVH